MALYDVSTEAGSAYRVSLQAHMGLKLVLILRKIECWVAMVGFMSSNQLWTQGTGVHYIHRKAAFCRHCICTLFSCRSLFLTNGNYLQAVEACRFSEAVGIPLSTTAESLGLHS